VGLFVAAVTLVAVSCYFVFNDTATGGLKSSFMYFGTELMLLSILLVVVVAAGVKFQRLRFVHVDAESVLDRSLIVVAVFGEFVFDWFHLVSALSLIASGESVTILWAVTAVISCIQVLASPCVHRPNDG